MRAIVLRPGDCKLQVLQHHKLMGGLGKDLKSVRRNDSEILKSHAKLSRQIDSRLHRYHIAHFKRQWVARRQRWQLMDINTHPMAQAMAHFPCEAMGLSLIHI